MDIVERLRERSGEYDEYSWHSDIELEAADEIERLRAALKPFAEIADDWDHLDDEDYVSVHKYDIELRHFRAIRAALKETE